MTLYRTIDTSTEIETSEVLDTALSTNAVALTTASASLFLTREEAIAHKKKQLTALADAATKLANKAEKDIVDFDASVGVAPL